MALLLRLEGDPGPARRGLPARASATAANVETILQSGSHAWVEVYFPGYGWQHVRPDRGPAARDTSLPAGPVVSRATGHAARVAGTGRAGRSAAEHPADPERRGRRDDRRPGGSSSGPFIVIGLLLAVAMGGLAFLAWQRGPRDGVRAGRGLAEHRRARPSVRLRAAAEPDRVRVHRGARRGPPERPARPADGRPGEGRGRLRARAARRRPAAGAARRPAPAAGRAAGADLPPSRAARAAASRADRRRRGEPAGARATRLARGWPLRPRCGPRRPPSPGSAARPWSGPRWSVRLWARRTARPATSSTTLIPVSAHGNVQNRSSGRSSRASRATLKMPSWPTRSAHGASLPWPAG